MPELDEVLTARISRLRLLEHFIGFEIHEPKTHGAVAHNAFEVSPSSAAAELFFRIERHDRVACFPNAFPERISAKPNAVPQGPDANQAIKLSAAGSDAGGHHVGIIEDRNR